MSVSLLVVTTGDKSSLRKEELVLVGGVRAQSSLSDKMEARAPLAVGQEWCEVAGHTASSGRKLSTACWCSAQVLLFSFLFSLAPWPTG